MPFDQKPCFGDAAVVDSGALADMPSVEDRQAAAPMASFSQQEADDPQQSAAASGEQALAALHKAGAGPLAGVLALLPAAATQPVELQLRTVPPPLPEWAAAAQPAQAQPGNTAAAAGAVQPSSAAASPDPAPDPQQQQGAAQPLPVSQQQHATAEVVSAAVAAPTTAQPPVDEHAAAARAVAALEGQVPVVDSAALDAAQPPRGIGQQLANRHQAAVAHQASCWLLCQSGFLQHADPLKCLDILLVGTTAKMLMCCCPASTGGGDAGCA